MKDFEFIVPNLYMQHSFGLTGTDDWGGASRTNLAFDRVTGTSDGTGSVSCDQ